jgi:chromosome segregation ATPase
LSFALIGAAVRPAAAQAAAAAEGNEPVAITERASTKEGDPLLGDAVGELVEGNDEEARIQAEIEKLSDNIDDLATEYRRILQDTRSLEVYNQQVADLIESQTAEMGSLEEQIEGVTAVSREIVPLMVRMIDTLEKFVELDLPFLLEERRERVAKLREIMERADVSLSEKYRRLMEAYQIENEFGRTIEAYRAELTDDGTTRTVDFLRIGRVALLYQTLDAAGTRVWDQKQKTWVDLGDDYRSPVRQGLRMARKQIAPDLLLVPVAAAEDAR